MKNLLFLFILFLTISCASNKGVYWCGDHPCINKKEKEAYFKKNMIIEMKSAKKTDYKNNSEVEILMRQAKDKERIEKIDRLAKERLIKFTDPDPRKEISELILKAHRK